MQVVVIGLIVLVAIGVLTAIASASGDDGNRRWRRIFRGGRGPGPPPA